MSAAPTTARPVLRKAFHAEALDHIEDGVLAITPDGRVAYANAAVLGTLRTPYDALIGREIWDILPEMADTIFRRQYDRARETGETVVFEAFATPYRLWLRVRMVPGRDGMAVYLTDITPMLHAQQTRARPALDPTDELLAMTSHELRTPLTCMLGWSELAMEMDTLEVYRQAVPIMRRHARRQERLVANLLDMSNLLRGRLSCRRQPVDLGRLATRVVGEMTPAAREAGVALTIEGHEALPLSGDPARLRQCMTQLVDNAIKYTGGGGQVTVTCRRVGDSAEVVIADNGRGIAVVDMHKLFVPLLQVDRDEAAGGLGLGLPIARGIAELHGGTLVAHSDGPGCGSTFTLRLPMQRP